MIDYNNIIDNLQEDKVFDLLENLGAEPIDKEDYILCKTICHHDDYEEANHKLYYYKDTHLFMCYSNCGGMNIFTLLKKYYEARGIKYEWKKDIWEVIINCSTGEIKQQEDRIKFDLDKYKSKKAEIELPKISENILNIFTKFYPPEWLDEGISKEAMDLFNIKYSIDENKIIIPHYDYNNNLVGIRGRALNLDEIERYGKYMPVYIGDKLYNHPLSLNLYGLNITKDAIKKHGVCIFFEGEKSTMQMESFNMPNVSVATCGSTLNKYQIDLILKVCNPKEIIVAYDNEEEKYTDFYFNKLYKLGSKYTNLVNISFIYDRNNITNKKDSPVDCGEEAFRKLLSKRVRIN